MPKLPRITYKKLQRVLEKSGFQIDHTTGSHFIFYNKMSKKRVTLPFHTKELAKGTLMSILKEAGISYLLSLRGANIVSDVAIPPFCHSEAEGRRISRECEILR